MTNPKPGPKRKFEKPVAWLLGRQLMASLKLTLLYTAFGSKIDARDWMDAKVFPSDNKVEAENAWKTMHAREKDSGRKEKAAREGEREDFWAERGDFWFDYISDTGDGMKATYSIAYLCLSNLWVQDLWEQKPPGDIEVGLEHQGPKEGEELEQLPRGEFLLVGGDTSYHMADYSSLHTRFQLPFRWAYQDLNQDLGKVEAKPTDEEKEKNLRNLRPIFGIPGNHDYYDMLDGFRRQFRVPTRSRSEDKRYENEFDSSQLQIPTFRRFQETSYIALRLPFEWMLWGLDTEVGKLDERQRDFFKGVNNGSMPKKLIVCTSAPTTVFGKFADKEDEKSAKAFLQLDLPRPFLESENGNGLKQGKRDKAAMPEKPERKLGDDEIRLDLAGDVHHYARYWGPPSPNTQPTRSHVPHREPLSATNYASVMSGLGGAFHHPSTTYVDEIREQALYPQEDDSRAAVAGQIFNPWRVVKGGGVWLVGGIIALMLAFATIVNTSSRPAIHNVSPFNWLGITEPDHYDATISSNSEAKKEQANVRTSVWRMIGITQERWTPQLPDRPDCKTTDVLERPVYLWGKCKTVWPNEYMVGFYMLLATIPLMIAAIFATRKLYETSEKQQEVLEEARKADKPEDRPTKSQNVSIVRKVNWTLGLLTLLTIVVAAAGLLAIEAYRDFITPFGNSLLVLLTISWAATATYLSITYSDWLSEQAAKRTIRKRDWIITWVLSAAAVIGLIIGLWIFGKNNLAAYLVSDIIFVVIVTAIPLLLYFVATSIGGALHTGAKKWIGMGSLGLWHGLLQLGVAIFMIKKGTWLTVILAVSMVLIFWLIGRNLMRFNRPWWLTFAWIEFGSILLLLPPLVYHGLIKYRDYVPRGLLDVFFWPHAFDPAQPFSTYEWWISLGGWGQLAPILLAGVFGALLSCVWLGWYFGVSLGFNSHNNEAGGAARIENYKQFVRIRLTRNSLTGYVIAVNDVSMIGEPVEGNKEVKKTGRYLKPKLIDVFHLTFVKPSLASRTNVQD